MLRIFDFPGGSHHKFPLQSNQHHLFIDSEFVNILVALHKIHVLHPRLWRSCTKIFQITTEPSTSYYRNILPPLINLLQFISIPLMLWLVLSYFMRVSVHDFPCTSRLIAGSVVREPAYQLDGVIIVSKFMKYFFK